ncbi:MAG: ATP-dependent metallopeptidase FtsH/Yme1/Tma family protein, partial [Acidimicrobiales bacterium]
LFGIIFLAKGGDSTMADIAGFGRLGRKGKKGRGKGKGNRPSTGVSFADVGGAEEAVAELREVTDYLRDPKRFEAYGAAAPKGVLLFGPPGCGKTLLARAVAGEAGVPFFAVSGAEFVESLVGVGAARVRDLFRQVKEVAPAIVFIDEIDAVGRRRSGEGSTGGEREQTVNQLLVELDGFEVNQGIVLMGATNRPDILDPALLRPGRFDRHVTLEPPEVHGRQAILELHAKDKPMADGIDFAHLAKRTPGFTGADLANVVNEGALLAIRQGSGAKVGMDQLNEAVLRVLHGPQRRGKLVTGEERRRLAYHESAHALVAAGLGQAGAIQRVSIVARSGRSLGSSVIASDDERVLFTTSELEARLCIAMAGAAAEALVFGDRSTTSEDDLAKANAMAREMVGLHGMSTEVGPLRLLSTDGGYLGGEARLVDAVSGATLGAFDAAVRALVEAATARAGEILAANRDQLDRMADALEEQETLEGPA